MLFQKQIFQWGLNSLLLNMRKKDQIENSRKQLRNEQTLEDVKNLKSLGLFRGHQILKSQLKLFFQFKKLIIKDIDQNYQKYLILKWIEQIEKYTKSNLKTESNLKLFNRFQNGLILSSESNLDTSEQTQIMLKYCQKNYPKQFQIAFTTRAQNFVIDSDDNIIGISINKGVVLGENLIICLEHKSKELAFKLRLNLPIVPIKGWTLERFVPKNFNQTLIQEFTLNTPNYFALNLNGHLRLAGFIDDTLSIDASREWGAIQILKIFNEQNGFDFEMSDFTVKSCFRPLTPDDVAIISEVPGFKNIFINTGHGTRGMSYYYSAADIMSQVMEGSKAFEDYSVKRFYFI